MKEDNLKRKSISSLLMMSALYLFNPVVKRQCASI